VSGDDVHGPRAGRGRERWMPGCAAPLPTTSGRRRRDGGRAS
jgi:hypothetical protein